MSRRRKHAQRAAPDAKCPSSVAPGRAESTPNIAARSDAASAPVSLGDLLQPRFLWTSAALVAVFAWSFWPVLVELVHAWQSEADYSHGFLVVPASCYFLWARRASLPTLGSGFAWGGAALLLASVALRLCGAVFYVDAIEAWSLPFWVAGCVWLLCGRRVLVWSWPGLVFLAFMIPLPFRAEHLLSYPLQRSATKLSCWMLQTLGQPAITEGNIVVINDVQLNVAEACSGLRIFVSILALAFAYIVLVQRPWWVKLALALAVLPVSLIVNASRIALTGLANLYLPGAAAHAIAHDATGWLMLPLAALLLAAVLWYAGRLIVRVETVSSHELLLSKESAV